jgi:membrane protease YdiL (CAAX protease family)
VIRDGVVDLTLALLTGASGILLVAVGVAIAMGIGQNGSSLQSALLSAWGVIAMLAATQLPLLFFALRRRSRNRTKLRLLPELFAGETIPAVRRGIAAGALMAILSGIYTSIVQRFAGSDVLGDQLGFLEDALGNRVAFAILIAIVAILAPICEELFFRGVIFGSAHAAGFKVAGAAVSAVLFSIVHVSVLLAPFYAAFAVVMCWLFAKSQTLAAPIAAHMTLNGLACLALVLSQRNSV